MSALSAFSVAMLERRVPLILIPHFWPVHQDRRDDGERSNRVDVEIKRTHGVGLTCSYSLENITTLEASSPTGTPCRHRERKCHEQMLVASYSSVRPQASLQASLSPLREGLASMLGPLRKSHRANGNDANRGNQHVESELDYFSSQKNTTTQKYSSTAITINEAPPREPPPVQAKGVPVAFETCNDAASISHSWTLKIRRCPLRSLDLRPFMEIECAGFLATSYYDRNAHEDRPVMNIHARTEGPTKSDRATARVTLLMTPTEKEALFVKAAQEGLGVSEYLRRKAFGQESDLDALVSAVHESTERAVKVVDRALAHMAGRERNAAKHDAQVRAKAATEFESWTSEQKNAVSRMLGS